MGTVFRQISTGSELGRLQSTALGLHTGGGHGDGARGDGNVPATERTKKQPKPVNYHRLVAGKIAMLSGKHADIMAWTSKVTESDKLFLDDAIRLIFCSLKFFFYLAIETISTLKHCLTKVSWAERRIHQ